MLNKENENILENNGDNIENSQNNTDAQVNANEKTFTQAEVDEIVKRRLTRALKDYPDKEEIVRLQKLKDETQDKDRIISELKSNADLNAQRLATYELREKLIKNGVDLKFADFALYEVKKGIDTGLDFEAAFEGFIEDNDFLVKNKKTTGLRQGGAIASQNSVEESFYKINPSLKKGGF